MARPGFYLALLGMRLRMSLTASLQYRWQFFGEALMSLFWAGVSLVPLLIFGALDRPVQGWTYPEMVVVTGWFIVLKGIIDVSINPSLTAVIEHVRNGTLDFVLIKPADAQFLVSTTSFNLLRLTDCLAGGVLLVHAFGALGRVPSPGQIAAALVLLLAAVAVIYALWVLVICVSFRAVRLDNLAFLLQSVFDFARWPVSIFRGALRVFFTFVIPLAIMTTYPALALLGRLSPTAALLPLGVAMGFTVIARRVWLASLARYTSASS